MAETDQRKPWVKFYFKDWRGDKALRACSLAARGLWMEMLSIMDEAEPYGHLMINGHPLDAEELANQAGGGASTKEVKALLERMRKAGVFGETNDGVIYCKRMVRDKAKLEEDRVNGKKGGNPRLKGDDTYKSEPDNPPGKPPTRTGGLSQGDKAQKPDARGQKPEDQAQPSEAETGGRQSVDLGQEVLRILGRNPAETLQFGKVHAWLSSGFTPDEIKTVAALVGDRMKPDIRDPLSYLAKAMPDEVAKLRAAAAPADAQADAVAPGRRSQWVARYADFKRVGVWPDGWGPKPGQPRCECPQDVIDDAELEVPPTLKRPG